MGLEDSRSCPGMREVNERPTLLVGMLELDLTTSRRISFGSPLWKRHFGRSEQRTRAISQAYGLFDRLYDRHCERPVPESWWRGRTRELLKLDQSIWLRSCCGEFPVEHVAPSATSMVAH